MKTGGAAVGFFPSRTTASKTLLSFTYRTSVSGADLNGGTRCALSSGGNSNGSATNWRNGAICFSKCGRRYNCAFRATFGAPATCVARSARSWKWATGRTANANSCYSSGRHSGGAGGVSKSSRPSAAYCGATSFSNSGARTANNRSGWSCLSGTQGAAF